MSAPWRPGNCRGSKSPLTARVVKKNYQKSTTQICMVLNPCHTNYVRQLSQNISKGDKMTMLVTSIGEKVEINWLAENPLDTVKRTGEMEATLRDLDGNHYVVGLGSAKIEVGEYVNIEILEV